MSRKALNLYTQTLFGGPEAPPAERGDCDRNCLASFIGEDPFSIPHFYGSDDELSVQHHDYHKWLEKKGFYRVCFINSERSPWWFPLGLCIVLGKSPRGNWNHVVIGEITSRVPLEWRMVHDPHPSRDGIVGEPLQFEFILPIGSWNKVDDGDGNF